VAAVPLFLIHESYDDDVWAKIVRYQWTKSEGGQVTLPEGKGLCLEVDEAALAAAAKDPNYKYEWRGPRLNPDGSIADY
jgi:L-alanine-DL-glutamate epimerase-like enolase superfamily enzyme